MECYKQFDVIEFLVVKKESGLHPQISLNCVKVLQLTEAPLMVNARKNDGFQNRKRRAA